MRSEAQRQASRINGAKSKGPTTPEGKAITRFNGLTHTLCAVQAVLPGEDPAEFEAHRDALFDDWGPMSYTRSLLVERLVIASWRLRRAVTSESALRARAADDAVRAYDDQRQEAVERAVDRFEDDPRAALTLLRSSRPRHRPPHGRLGRAGRGPGGRPGRLVPAVSPAADAPARPPRRHRPDHRRAAAHRLGAAAGLAQARRQAAAEGRGGGVGRGPPSAGGRGHRPAPGTPAGGAGHVRGTVGVRPRRPRAT